MTRLLRWVAARYGYRFFVCMPLAGLFGYYFAWSFNAGLSSMAVTPWFAAAVFMVRLALIPRKVGAGSYQRG